MTRLIDRPIWHALKTHQIQQRHLNMADLIQSDPRRVAAWTQTIAGLTVDFSKHLATDETMVLLRTLADETHLSKAISKCMSGATVNESEHRSALHTALRMGNLSPAPKAIRRAVEHSLQRMTDFVQAVHHQHLLGYTGRPLRQIVNIGIGGSHLGPKVVSDALQYRWAPGFDLRYIANVDGFDFHQATANLDPESTLFVICSKSFSTLETQLNAKAARAWLIDQLGSAKAVPYHFVAVSTQIDSAIDFGIPAKHVFPLWDWVGGRYSLWSSVGLAQAIVLGMPAFLQLLAGAAQMDHHFKDAPLTENIPITLGLLDIWYLNFWAAKTRAVLVYDQSLHEFPAHLQQLEMESNGKSVTRSGAAVHWATGAVVWGGAGTNGQHAYHQLLHQGTQFIPVDFIMPLTSHYALADHHHWLFAHFLGQQQALLQGQSLAEVRMAMQAKGASAEELERIAPHRVIAGNRPHTSITMDALTPNTLGALIALYEHRVFVQAHLWDINAFDQWGVELGKSLGVQIYQALSANEDTSLDAATRAQIQRFKSAQQR